MPLASAHFAEFYQALRPQNVRSYKMLARIAPDRTVFDFATQVPSPYLYALLSDL